MTDEAVTDIQTWRDFLAGFGLLLGDGIPLGGRLAGVTRHHIGRPYGADVYVHFTEKGKFWCLIGERR